MPAPRGSRALAGARMRRTFISERPAAASRTRGARNDIPAGSEYRARIASRLPPSLDALGDDRRFEVTTYMDDRADDGHATAVAVDAADKVHIDLDHIRREAAYRS